MLLFVVVSFLLYVGCCLLFVRCCLLFVVRCLLLLLLLIVAVVAVVVAVAVATSPGCHDSTVREGRPAGPPARSVRLRPEASFVQFSL